MSNRFTAVFRSLYHKMALSRLYLKAQLVYQIKPTLPKFRSSWRKANTSDTSSADQASSGMMPQVLSTRNQLSF